MKQSDLVVLVIAAAVLYFVWKHEQATVRAVVAPAPANGLPPPLGMGTASGVTQALPSPASGLTGSAATAAGAAKSIESAVSAYTHVPLASVGQLAQRAPAWTNVVAPLATQATKFAQNFIDNPVGTVKNVGTTIGHDVAHPVDTVKSAASSVKNTTVNTAKSVYSGVASAAGAVGGAAKKVLSWL